ncbi:MAG TPA: cobalt transporter CbiM [Methanosarcinaceae archaeon]|nr:cobalt transporter CbiM [Methanosarcinaceae archaeon]
MHISDGVLSPMVIAVGFGITLVLLVITLWWNRNDGNVAEQIPKLSVMTGAFFVASLIHIPVPPTSVHLILNGLMGVVLGLLAYPAIFIGLILQALLFQHGGITTIGINSVIMGIPALISYGIFKVGYRKGIPPAIIGAISGGFAIFLAVIFLATALITTGEEFIGIAKLVTISHIPIIIIEAVITGSVVAFLVKVKPELLPIDVEVTKDEDN